MKNNKGFVLLETVITICVLSVVLISLYSSYAYILRKSLQRNTYDVTESIYEGYYITELIKNKYTSINNYVTNNCTNLNPGYKCEITDTSELKELKRVYMVDKLYYINPKTFYSNHDQLNKLDATTIDYINTIGVSNNRDMLIIKYKIIYQDGTYEIFHSKVEV